MSDSATGVDISVAHNIGNGMSMALANHFISKSNWATLPSAPLGAGSALNPLVNSSVMLSS